MVGLRSILGTGVGSYTLLAVTESDPLWIRHATLHTLHEVFFRLDIGCRVRGRGELDFPVNPAGRRTGPAVQCTRRACQQVWHPMARVGATGV